MVRHGAVIGWLGWGVVRPSGLESGLEQERFQRLFAGFGPGRDGGVSGYEGLAISMPSTPALRREVHGRAVSQRELRVQVVLTYPRASCHRCGGQGPYWLRGRGEDWPSYEDATRVAEARPSPGQRDETALHLPHCLVARDGEGRGSGALLFGAQE